VDVGVHVTLVGEPWMSGKRFFASWSRLMPWLMLPGRRALLEREIRVQIQTMLDNGIAPTHLDSHQHVHVMPPIWGVCESLATEFGITRIRTPATPARSIAKQSIAGTVLQRLSESRARRLPHALPCIGIAHAGHNTSELLVAELEASGGKDIELVAHPATDTPSLREKYGFWNFDWETERQALLGAAFGDACGRLGYQIGRRSDRR
jgi:predicted glycoside hydrolase/deacetylase ChbG (UPF0249 family)